MYILGIETSCDETGVSIVKDGFVLSNVISSSLPLHRRFGGIIPEIASRAHLEQITKVTQTALKKARLKLKDIDLISVTNKPGLPGALLVGLSFARSLSFALDIKLLEIDHLKAHIYANFLNPKKPRFPFIGLVISGGHSHIFKVRDIFNWQVLGATLDDAVGESFDKVAKILGLGFPGGPIIEKLAKYGNPNKIKLSSASLGDSFDFSFSGIKTALLYKVRDILYRSNRKRLETREVKDICASFQKQVVDVLVKKAIAACLKNKIKDLAVGGGVSINNFLRKHLIQEASINKIRVFFPNKEFCLDNASMVATLGYYTVKKY